MHDASADVQRITLNASCMTILGRRTEQLDIIAGFLPRHWLYGWFSQFHSCETYSVLSRSPSLYPRSIPCANVNKCSQKDVIDARKRKFWAKYSVYENSLCQVFARVGNLRQLYSLYYAICTILLPYLFKLFSFLFLFLYYQLGWNKVVCIMYTHTRRQTERDLDWRLSRMVWSLYQRTNGGGDPRASQSNCTLSPAWTVVSVPAFRICGLSPTPETNNKRTSCLHHLISPARDTSVTTRLRLTTSLPGPDLRTKKILFIRKLWPTPLPTNRVTPNPLYTSLPAHVYIYAHCLFCLLFYLLFQLHIICYPALGPQGCY